MMVLKGINLAWQDDGLLAIGKSQSALMQTDAGKGLYTTPKHISLKRLAKSYVSLWTWRHLILQHV